MMAVSVFRTVTARYKAVQEQMRQNPYKYKDEYGDLQFISRTLEWLWKPIVFKRPQVDLVNRRDYRFLPNEKKLSLNTLGKRIIVDYEDQHFEEYFDGTWSFGTGKIVKLKGHWYFHIPVRKDVQNTFSRDTVQHVVGIDRGLRCLITACDENGKCLFDSGKDILRKRQKFLECRKELQSKHTWSAHCKLKQLSGRENRWMSDVNHRISKTLVSTYGEHTLFVLEDLTGISFDEDNLSRSKKANGELRSWPFYQLEQFLTYKAEATHSQVLKVPAKYTCQRCPKCGGIHKTNRHHQTHEYICDYCGYRSNDNRVGAMNIQYFGALWVSGDEHPHLDIRRK